MAPVSDDLLPLPLGNGNHFSTSGTSDSAIFAAADVAIADAPEAPATRGILDDFPGGEEAAEEEEDLLALVEADLPDAGYTDDGSTPEPEESEGADGEEAVATAPKTRSKKSAAKLEVGSAPGDVLAELGYRFPYSRAVLEVVPDLQGLHGQTFCLRLVWHRGKAVLPLIESTPLRHIAEVQRGGQKYPIFPSQHARKRREQVVIGGKRKTAKSPRCALRCASVITGRGDRFLFLWRFMASAAAMAVPPQAGSDGVVPPDEVTISLPFAPGKSRFLTVPGSEDRAVAVWMNDVVVSVVALAAENRTQDGAPITVQPVLRSDARGAYLTLPDANLSGEGVTLRWEAWVAPARTESEALAFLLQHLADAADRAQQPHSDFEETAPALSHFNDLARNGERELMRDDYIDKRGVDKLSYRPVPGKTGMNVFGEGVDAALVACTLLGRYRQTGDDALRRRARLLSNGICEAQVNIEESAHWGAVWDAIRAKKHWEDVCGKKTLSVATTARASKGLHVLHGHFGVEMYTRTAMAAAQWLLLKLDREGRFEGERFTEEGPAVPGGSPWIVGEALIPLIETYRRTDNEVFLKTAFRIVTFLKEGIQEMRLPLVEASTENLAAAIEGILLVSREWENEEMIALARQISLALRARRLPDGSFRDPAGVHSLSELSPTLAAARAALALSRVDNDPLWVTLAMRAVRVAARRAAAMDAEGRTVTVADRMYLCALPTQILLTIAQRAQPPITGEQTQADRDELNVRRGWQTFAPDPATNEYVQVYAPGTQTPIDHLSLVCPVTQQVLVAVLAPPGMTSVDILKTGRRPFVKNLLNGDLDAKYDLSPLGDGAEGNIGVFLADT